MAVVAGVSWTPLCQSRISRFWNLEYLRISMNILESYERKMRVVLFALLEFAFDLPWRSIKTGWDPWLCRQVLRILASESDLVKDLVGYHMVSCDICDALRCLQNMSCEVLRQIRRDGKLIPLRDIWYTCEQLTTIRVVRSVSCFQLYWTKGIPQSSKRKQREPLWGWHGPKQKEGTPCHFSWSLGQLDGWLEKSIAFAEA